MSAYRIDDDLAFAFLDALQEEFALYQQLLQMSLEQKQLIELAAEKELFELMERKQELIERIESFGKKYRAQRELLVESAMGTFSSIDEQFDRVLLEIEKVLKVLIENEADDMNMLKDFIATGNQRVKHLDQGKQLAKAYLKSRSAPSMNRKV